MFAKSTVINEIRILLYRPEGRFEIKKFDFKADEGVRFQRVCAQ